MILAQLLDELSKADQQLPQVLHDQYQPLQRDTCDLLMDHVILRQESGL